jgi:hypothetical protein
MAAQEAADAAVERIFVAQQQAEDRVAVLMAAQVAAQVELERAVDADHGTEHAMDLVKSLMFNVETVKALKSCNISMSEQLKVVFDENKDLIIIVSIQAKQMDDMETELADANVENAALKKRNEELERAAVVVHAPDPSDTHKECA